jgi:hypothetical protein
MGILHTIFLDWGKVKYKNPNIYNDLSQIQRDNLKSVLFLLTNKYLALTLGKPICYFKNYFGFIH